MYVISLGIYEIELRSSILFINRVYPPDAGATGRILRDLARRFAAAGWRVTVLACGAAERPIEAGGGEDGITVLRTGAPDGRDVAASLRQLAALAAGLRRVPPVDVAVTMTDPPLLALLAPLLRRRPGAVLLHWCQDLYPDLLPALGAGPVARLAGLGRGLAARAMAAHDAVVAIGGCMAERLAALGVPPERIATIANWAPPALRPDPAAAAAFRAAHGLNGRVVAMYSGNFGRAHPFGAVLGAAAQLRDRRPDLLLMMIGDGPKREALRQAAEERALTNLRFLEMQPEALLSGSLGAADLHLVTQHAAAEGLMVPCKLYGALAVGRPCLFLGPERGEAGRLLRSSGAGLVLGPEDGAGLAGALERLAEAPAERQAMAERALAAAARCRLDEAAAAFLGLATRLLAERRGATAGLGVGAGVAGAGAGAEAGPAWRFGIGLERIGHG